MKHLLMLAEARMVHTQRWATALVSRGWRVTVWSEHPRPIAGVIVIPLATPRFGLSYPQRWWGRLSRHLRDTIDRLTPDVVHVHYLQDYPVQGLARRGGSADGPPLVISTWGADIIQDQTVPRDTEAQRRRKVALLRAADAVTATTGYLADCTARYAGLDRAAITVIPFGVDVERYAPPVERSTRGGLVVGFIKHLEPKYGPEVFLRSMPMVRERFAEVRFIMIGEGSQEPALRRLAGDLGVGASIDWRGPIDNGDVPAALWGMDVLVMPSVSRSETFGVVAVEAQAAGVPVVFSDLPGVREAVEDGVGGLAVAPGDVEALADAVCRLLADEPLRRRLGANGRQAAVQRFKFGRNVDQMEGLYQRVMPRPTAMAV